MSTNVVIRRFTARDKILVKHCLEAIQLQYRLVPRRRRRPARRAK